MLLNMPMRSHVLLNMPTSLRGRQLCPGQNYGRVSCEGVRQPANKRSARRRAMEVAVACYGAEGTLLLGEAAGQQERTSKLVGLARDLSKAPVGTATGTFAGGPGLRETVTELGSAVPGAGPVPLHNPDSGVGLGLLETVAESSSAVQAGTLLKPCNECERLRLYSSFLTMPFPITSACSHPCPRFRACGGLRLLGLW